MVASTDSIPSEVRAYGVLLNQFLLKQRGAIPLSLNTSASEFSLDLRAVIFKYEHMIDMPPPNKDKEVLKFIKSMRG